MEPDPELNVKKERAGFDITNTRPGGGEGGAGEVKNDAAAAVRPSVVRPEDLQLLALSPVRSSFGEDRRGKAFRESQRRNFLNLFSLLCDAAIRKTNGCGGVRRFLLSSGHDSKREEEEYQFGRSVPSLQTEGEKINECSRERDSLVTQFKQPNWPALPMTRK